MCWWQQWGQEEWKERRDLALGLWPKRMVNGVVVSVECTHGKNNNNSKRKKKKKQIKCVKERALGDKAEVCEASFEELGIHLNVLIHYVVLSK